MRSCIVGMLMLAACADSPEDELRAAQERWDHGTRFSRGDYRINEWRERCAEDCLARAASVQFARDGLQTAIFADDKTPLTASERARIKNMPQLFGLIQGAVETSGALEVKYSAGLGYPESIVIDRGEASEHEITLEGVFPDVLPP